MRNGRPFSSRLRRRAQRASCSPIISNGDLARRFRPPISICLGFARHRTRRSHARETAAIAAARIATPCGDDTMISRAIFRYALHAWKAALFAAMLTATSGPSLAAPLSYRELLSPSLPAATKRIAYGAAPHQFGDLYLPAAPGPHLGVVLIHGGCWLASLPRGELMAQAADDLRPRGNAGGDIDNSA